MMTRILAGEEGITEAVEMLRRGEVVGLPTETVYGLAGDAFAPLAVARIFEAKKRPLTDPLIVHLPGGEWLDRIALFNSPEQKAKVEQLAAAFWPGPLTLILKKNPRLPDLVTAGLESVAVRVTADPLFQEVLRRLNSPLAAPSANRFGRISPTTAEDVRRELGSKIPLIVDGGACLHGMESTIVAVMDEGLKILRPGPIIREQLSEYGDIFLPDADRERMHTPGGLLGHYAPKKELRIIEADISQFSPDSKAGLLAFRTPAREVAQKFTALEILSPTGDLREAAANFYKALRRLDEGKSAIIYAEALPEEGIGIAIMDRLRRAAFGSLSSQKNLLKSEQETSWR
jgi:L-threonylcarbamoyladenylate synthase